MEYNMNANQAKTIVINDYLKSIGIKPIKIKYNDYWYLSPFRIEKEPSFKVNDKKNIWYDFGIGKGGNIIDLIMNLHNCNISKALLILDDKNYIKTGSNHSFSFDQQDILNFKVKPINSIALIEYLRNRGIEIALAMNYCLEASYITKDKYYFGIAFKNDINGYEIRNKYIKINLFGKSITTIYKSNSVVNVYEGFIDFLSYLQINGSIINQSNIILNGLGLIPGAIEILKQYSEVNLYLDNDESGKSSTIALLNEIPSANDLSYIYADYKDINDYLLVKKEK
jgi:DNA primase